MNSLNITKHPIDRTALIAGIMFTFAGLAYLVDDHGIINVTEGAVAGTVVIVIGLVLLLAAVIDSPDVPQLATEASADTTDGLFGSATETDTTENADFSWATNAPAAPASPALFNESADLTPDAFDPNDEAE